MDQEFELYEQCTTQNSIVCVNCKNLGIKIDQDPYDSATEWIKEGWRITKNHNIYCPKCSKIKLKS